MLLPRIIRLLITSLTLSLKFPLIRTPICIWLHPLPISFSRSFPICIRTRIIVLFLHLWRRRLRVRGIGRMVIWIALVCGHVGRHLVRVLVIGVWVVLVCRCWVMTVVIILVYFLALSLMLLLCWLFLRSIGISLLVITVLWLIILPHFNSLPPLINLLQQFDKKRQFLILIPIPFILTYIIMNLKQPLSEIFHLDADSFIVCTGTNYKTVIKQNSKLRYADSLEILCKIINTLGQLSAASQGLKQVITNITRFSGSDQRIYIKVQDSQALGFVKVGQKTLFYRNLAGTIKQLHPTCVLDIYVHESCQRSGYGKEIFEKFLKEENFVPEQLAYDRPSPKLIAFLKKYYQLSQFVPQNNNFVIFNRFFTGNVNGNGNGTVSKYFFNRNRTASIQKQNRDSASKTSFKIADNTNTKSIISQQPSKQQKIIDSLQLLKQQVQKSKTRTTLELPYPQSQKPSYHNNPSSRPPQSNARYSLNMKLKDLSYRIPWATENGEGKGNFRTTSGMYGDVYRK